MILPIYLYGAGVLRAPAKDVHEDVHSLVSDMYETLLAADGCGLAAPQIGKSLRLFVVDGTGLADKQPECVGFKEVFINPVIVSTSKETVAYDEGCLSLPEVYASVVRPKTITVRYEDVEGHSHESTLTDFRARIFLHEYDHLEGHVFTDHVSPLKKQFLQRKLNTLLKGKVHPRYKTTFG